MKARFTLALLFLNLAFLEAQITVTQNDFASANDTARVSIANVPNNLNYKATGADTLWDYSFLTPSSQQVDQTLSIYNTNAVYAVYYADVSFNSRRSNLATNGNLNISSNFPIFPITISNEFNFFYKSSSVYQQTGLGLKIDGITTPIPYGHKDVMYNFPLLFGDTDQSNSDYAINIPYIGGFTQRQTRTNQVDGWGTLITPFGTFDVLREFTQINATDSFYIDTVHLGFAIPLPTQNQYKWIGNGQKEPLLQINTQVVLGIESVTSITYRDSVRNPPVVVNGIEQPNGNLSFEVFPNPANSHFAVFCPAEISNTELRVSDINGRELLHQAFNSQIQTVDASAWSKGVYLVELTNQQQRIVKRIVIE